MSKSWVGVLAIFGCFFLGSAKGAWAIGDFTRLAYLRYLHQLAGRAHAMNPEFLAIPGGAQGSVLSLFQGDSSGSQGLTRGTFDQRVDHQDPSNSQTFRQRYFILSTFASAPDAPVLYVICGEATCSEYDLEGAVAKYAEQRHAYVVALEHRYYGKSQPFPLLTSENLRYLSVDQALADLDSFEQFARTKLGMRGDWVSVGGSYSGALSAYFRQKYPNDVVGSLASSAPVQALENFELYDWTVNRGVGQACGDAMRRVVHAVEATLPDPEKLAQVKKLFDAETVENPVDFLYILADMGAMAVQYGHRDEFCQALSGSGDDQELVSRYAAAGKAIFSDFGETPAQDSFQSAESLKPEESGVGMRQWMYQSCTQFGFFQTAYHDPSQSVRSARINLAFNHWVCNHLFGISGSVPTAESNEIFYAPLLQPDKASRILFTNGSNDPWANLSITKANGNATNPNTEVDQIEGGAHCDDLGPPRSGDSASLQQARSDFDGLLSQWL